MNLRLVYDQSVAILAPNFPMSDMAFKTLLRNAAEEGGVPSSG